MFGLLFDALPWHTDTVRSTPGRPEMVDMNNSTRLWLLPKAQMDEVRVACRVGGNNQPYEPYVLQALLPGAASLY
jgi:hypothetical protein